MAYTLVTGATSDIGRQICKTLEESGHSLLLTDLLPEALENTKFQLASPENHFTLSLDLSDVEGAKVELTDFISSNGISVSGVVFAAGIFSIKPIKIVDYAFLKKNFDIALFSIFGITQVLTAKKVNASSLSSIVMISSVSAIMGTKGYTIYGAVKGAMLGLLKSLAAELSPNIRVNAILPGGVRTRTTNFLYENQESPNPRYLLGDGEPADIANMIEFLMSDRAKWITGQEFVVDGGLTSN